MMTRREALKKAALATVTCAAASAFRTVNAQSAPTEPNFTAHAGPFWLPPLAYSYDALEPHIDAETMQLHHDKHHATYIANLNKVVTDPKIASWPVDRILRNLSAVPEDVRNAVRNNAGGHYNHSIFWKMMQKNGGGAPKGSVAQAIDAKFTSFTIFKDVFIKAALAQFGSGWIWLTSDGKELRIEATANQDSPLSQGRLPILGVDTWEHAYYLKYQNRRADYVDSWFNVVNWDFVTEQFINAERNL